MEREKERKEEEKKEERGRIGKNVFMSEAGTRSQGKDRKRKQMYHKFKN